MTGDVFIDTNVLVHAYDRSAPGKQARALETLEHLATRGCGRLSSLIVLEAARGVDQPGLSYWDAQIWATARLNQISTVLTEDFTEGRVIDGVAFRDPFARGFALASLR